MSRPHRDQTPSGRSSTAADWLGAAARWLALLAASAFFLFPLYWLGATALKPWSEWTPASGVFWYPHHPTFENFRDVLGLTPLVAHGVVASGEPGLVNRPETPVIVPFQSVLWPLARSLVAATGGTALALSLGALAAFALISSPTKRRRFSFLVLMVRMTPPLTLLVPLLIMIAYLHLFDSLLALILVYGAFTFPYALWLIRSYLRDADRSCYEAAIVDGCTPLSALRKALLPQIRTGLLVTAFFLFVLNWSDFQIAYFLTDQTQTAPVYLQNLVGEHGATEFGLQAVVALLIIVPTLIFSLLLRRHLTRGFSLGTIRR